MKFKEKLMKEHPDCVKEMYTGGCKGCPSDYGYEPDNLPRLCKFKHISNEVCSECWSRELNEQLCAGYTYAKGCLHQLHSHCSIEDCSTCPYIKYGKRCVIHRLKVIEHDRGALI